MSWIHNREWAVLRSLQHPHIVGLADKLRYENTVVKVTKMVVECMDMDLTAFMRKGEKRCLHLKTSHGLHPRHALDLDISKEIFYAIALALDYLHRKLIVHL